MTYDELVVHARKFNKHKLVPAFDPCEKSYIVELVHALDTIPADEYAGQPTGAIIDSVHVGVGEALFNYCATTDSYYNDGEHVMEYVLALFTEYGNDSEALDEFRMGLDPTSDDGEEFTSIYDLARVYRCDDGDRTCFMVRSDEEGCQVWLVFTVEPKTIG
jgi:hypothetical protein